MKSEEVYKIIEKSMNKYEERIENCKKIYKEVLEKAPDTNKGIWKIEDEDLFGKIIFNFTSALDGSKTDKDLRNIYDIGLHMTTKAIIIANKGATLYSLTDKSEKASLIRHIGFIVYMPGMGVEYANVGLVGNVYDKGVVVRTESACTPSFVFGSQRCNCHYQWKNVKELATYFNPIETPQFDNGDDFESWVQEQYKYENGKHIYQNKSKLGFVMVHVDSQNGMGSGYTENEFVFDLTERASIRHRGEYTAEQTYKTTMYGGFTSIGLKGDPRREKDCTGYKITPIILDFLGINKKLIILTNNPLKLEQLEKFGYKLIRVKSIGAVNLAGATEASQRGSEFNHLDINGNLVTFAEDFERMKTEIKNIIESGEYKN